MTRVPQHRHGALYWVGVTLLGVWNLGMFALAMAAAQSYNSCTAEGGIICFDLAGPILLLLIAVDAVVAVIATIVHWLRHRDDATAQR